MTHRMTGPEYTHALSTLSLTPEQAATWLGIGRSTAYRYLKTGCEGPVAVALTMRMVGVRALEALEWVDRETNRQNNYTEVRQVANCWDEFLSATDDLRAAVGPVRHSDLTAAVGVGS